MNATPNYALNQWEPDDRVQRTDFNADNAKIDAAIKAAVQRADELESGKADKAALDTLSQRTAAVESGKADKTALDALSQRTAAVESGKADKTALNALSQTMTGKGNCRLVVGSYTGTGQIGQSHPNTLTFDFFPKIIFLDTHTNYSGSTSINYMILLEGLERFSDSNHSCNIIWNGKTVSWYYYDTSAKPDVQFNALGRVYHYIALGTAEK